jgi:C-terminal processing protease CtpA/Prc
MPGTRLLLLGCSLAACTGPPDVTTPTGVPWGQALRPVAVSLEPGCGQGALAGPAGARAAAVDLSAAHALVRAFGVDSAFAPSDVALAAALGADGALEPPGLAASLEQYAGALADVCALPARPETLGPAEVRTLGSLAVVRPGSGPVTLPVHTQLVIIDLRRVPEVDGVEAALAASVAPALASPVARPARRVRTHDGPVDEVFSAFNVYRTGVGHVHPAPLPASGSRELPVVLLVGEALAPRAAAFAATLRAARRAWIAGGDVSLSAAESHWQGIGSGGLLVRTELLEQIERLPPEVFADQTVQQDDPADPATASYRRELTLGPGAATLNATISDAAAGSDLDLYLVHDRNGDGAFDLLSETVAGSASAGAEEQLTLAGPPPGRYQLVVHGFGVPGGNTTFSLTVQQDIGQTLPDRLPADLTLPGGHDLQSDLQDPVALAAAVPGHRPPPVAGPVERSAPLVLNPFGFRHPPTAARGELRAALIAAHGLVRLFYRYFPLVGDTIDDRLGETLAAADAHDGSDRVNAWRILRRFGEALHDGHQFVFSRGAPLFATQLPVWLEHVEGRPVVRRSRAPGVDPGDTIVALGGRPIEEVYAEELARTSAATPGYQRDLADRNIYGMNGPLTLTLLDTAGAQRTVTVAPPPIEDYIDVVDRGVSDRPSGPLTDLDAPHIYYLNMDGNVSRTDDDVLAALTQAAALGATGLVVDMRGYPNTNHYDIATRLIRTPFRSPIFDNNSYQGPGAPAPSRSQYDLAPQTSPPVFDGPIVLLTGPHAVSAAENFMIMLVGAGRLRAVVGQRSAGTNGNITGLSLPGGFAFTYTGMEILFPDGAPFHGRGITPTTEVPVTAQDLRQGIDRDLLTAIAAF